MSQGFAIETLVGARVLGQGTYVPEHIKNGKTVNAKCSFPVRVNKKFRKDDYIVTGWGKLADTMARSCSPGKVLNLAGDPQSYLGNLYNSPEAGGGLRLDNAGQPIQIRKSSVTIEKIEFGAESAKFIAEDIQAGRRPHQWNVPGTADAIQWKAILDAKKTQVWDGVSPTFGFARVSIPQGVQLTVQANAAGVAAGGQADLVNQVRTVLPAQQYQLEDGTPCDANGNPIVANGVRVVTVAGGAGNQAGNAALAY